MISYFSEDIDFNLKNKRLNNSLLNLVAEIEIKRLGFISVRFCSDGYLLDINKRYLQHDYFTDIITFDYTEGDRLSGDLFISVDTVRANAEEYGSDAKLFLKMAEAYIAAASTVITNSEGSDVDLIHEVDEAC